MPGGGGAGAIIVKAKAQINALQKQCDENAHLFQDNLQLEYAAPLTLRSTLRSTLREPAFPWHLFRSCGRTLKSQPWSCLGERFLSACWSIASGHTSCSSHSLHQRTVE